MVNTIARQPVTLSVAESETLIRVLRDTASAQYAHANRTKSPAVRDYCTRIWNECNTLEAEIVKRLYLQTVA